MERIFRNIILVEAFSEERVERIEIIRPEVGIRWGGKSDFEYSDDESLKAAADSNGGVTVKWAEEYRHSVRIIDWSPVYREYELLRVRNDENPDVYLDIEYTYSCLIPLGEENQQRIIGYNTADMSPRFETRIIATFINLQFPKPEELFGAQSLGRGSEGNYPDYAVEMFQTG